MKLKYIYLLAFTAIFYVSCKKDLGNYTYSPPSEPIVEGVKGVNFPALTGDTLIIKPKVSLEGADPMKDLNFEWNIFVLEELKNIVYTGYPLKMLYGLGPGERPSTLIVTDKRNGLVYKFKFTVTGTTQFSTGTVVLSSDGGLAKLSFVKPDNTVLSNIYQGLNNQSLSENPVQLYYSKPLPYQLLSKEEYWVLCNDASKGSAIVDANTLLYKDNFRSQFFLPPAAVVPGYIEPVMGTISNGVMNNKLYIGISSTAPFAPDYGKFANEQNGDYQLSRFFTHGSSFYFGFDNKSKAFVVFGGDGSYLGTTYLVKETTIFNPKATGMQNLIFMKAGESGTSYAYFREADGNTYELMFSYKLTGTDREIIPGHKRVFKGSSSVNADSKWVRNNLNVFYFSSNDKIWRYNPVNESLTELVANFNGKKVTMLKISDDGNTLTAGTNGFVYTLDVTVGKDGNITKTISGIPGDPVDVVIR
uniref:PKD-like family lipoprotein n=1 Tax=Pedobacter schmidteae TaxID=2201271 RepID=UPI000EB531FE|nr:PKD-like family lipoprotein [Pedobacter schmidteae]